MKKTITIIIIISIVIIGGFIFYEKFQDYKLMELLKPIVKNSSVRVTNEVRFEIEESKITFKELFEKLEADIAEIDKKIIEVQSIPNPNNKEKIDKVVVYLQACQELLRVLLTKSRKDLRYNYTVEWSQKTYDNIKNATSSFGIEYAANSAKDALKDMKKANEERIQSNIDVLSATAKFEDAYNVISNIMPPDTLVDMSMIEECSNQIKSIVDSARLEKK